MANKHKIKLTRNKEGQEGPQYSVTYKANLKNRVSYAILSALIGDRDVVMTIDTDLFFGTVNNEKAYLDEWVERFRAKGLAYSDRTVPSNKSFAVFGFVMNRGKKSKKEARQIAVYIPNAVWREEDFCLPAYGTQYYMAKAPMEAGETAARVLDMTGEEIAETFAMDVFDISVLGQIGLNARDMGEEALKRVLEL